MHKHIVMIFSIVGALTFGSGCTHAPSFPQTDNPEVTTAEDFDMIVKEANSLKGKTIKIAGKKVRVEKQDDGLLVIAEWLPFPTDDLHFTDVPPSQAGVVKKARGRRFTFLFPGTKEANSMTTWRGNKFILLADIQGEKMTPTSLTGRTASVPYLVARCIRVWKTGGSEIPHSPDTEFTAYPPLARTYCVD